jgi:hypothetical protein
MRRRIATASAANQQAHVVGHRVRVGHRLGDAGLSVGAPHHEALVVGLRLGGIPRYCSVSSTLSYQAPIFTISRARSAVAIGRPNRSDSPTAASSCCIVAMRSRQR